MSKGKELVKNTGILFIGKISTQFVSFLLLPLYTGKLATEEYGTLDLYTTIASILIPILSLQLEQAVYRFLLTNEEDEKTILSSTALFLLCSILLFIFIYIPVSYVLSIQYAALVLVYYIFSLLGTVVQQIPRGYGNYTDYTLSSFILSLVTIVFSVIFICAFNQGINGILKANVISSMVMITFVFLRSDLLRKIRIKYFKWNCLQKMLKYSIPLVFNQLASWIVNYSDRIIILAVLGVSVNGIYAIANKFFSLITTTLNIYNVAWTESVTKTLNDPDRNAYYNKVLELTTILFMLAASGVISGIGILFKYFIDASYSDAYAQIPILIYAAMFSGLSANVGSFYIAYKKTIEISRTTIATAVINVIVHVCLINLIGLYAASISTLLSFVAMFFYRLYKLCDIEPLHINIRAIIRIVPLSVFVLTTYYSEFITLQILSLFTLVIYIIYFLLSKDIIKRKMNTIIDKLKYR